MRRRQVNEGIDAFAHVQRSRERQRGRLGLGQRRGGRPAYDELRREHQRLRGFAASESCEEEFHGGFTHLFHGLGDNGQRRVHITCPKRVVETNDRDLLGNGDTFFADESDDAGGHFHVGHKERGGRMPRRKQLLRALIAGFLKEISELKVPPFDLDAVTAKCIFKPCQTTPRI
jgi:hypothetical protein